MVFLFNIYYVNAISFSFNVRITPSFNARIVLGCFAVEGGFYIKHTLRIKQLFKFEKQIGKKEHEEDTKN